MVDLHNRFNAPPASDSAKISRHANAGILAILAFPAPTLQEKPA
jgi:hypothetical protein